MSERPEVNLPVPLVVGFYLVMAAAGWGLAALLCPSGDVWWWGERLAPLWQRVGLGVGAGLMVVIGSQVLEEVADWAARLNAELSALLGRAGVGAAFAFAMSSALGEEIFFRGFLQRVLIERVFAGLDAAAFLGVFLSGAIFGALHTGPDREVFLPWSIMATVLGMMLGAFVLWTGDLLAAVLAHFTINFLNILAMSRK